MRIKGELMKGLYQHLAEPDEWERWKRNFRALRWIAAQKKKAKASAPPDFVKQAIAETIGTMQPTLDFPSQFLLRPVTADGELADFIDFDLIEDLQVFWQRAFSTALVPELISIPGFCSECGNTIPPTPKTGKPSKKRICEKCNTYQWRERNRDKYLKNQRRYTANNRAERDKKTAAKKK